MISKLLPISVSVLLVGCAGSVTSPDIVTHVTRGHIPIECGVEPRVDQVQMRPIDRPRIVGVNGSKWVAISLPSYENLSQNVADMVTSYQQRVAQVTWYRDCIHDFNERAEPEETP